MQWLLLNPLLNALHQVYFVIHFEERPMETEIKDIGTLFEQLGLPADEASIDEFIASHYPLPDDVKLSEAPFWNASQAGFLKGEILEDAEWAPIVDELNARLHANKPR